MPARVEARLCLGYTNIMTDPMKCLRMSCIIQKTKYFILLKARREVTGF